MVQVILKETMIGLGKFGNVVEVKPGYARNYLILKIKRFQSLKKNRAVIESQRKDLEKQEAARKSAAEDLAKKLAKETFEILATTADGMKLYGSVGVSEIHKLLSDKGYDNTEKKAINIVEGPIRELGEYEVLVTFHAEVQGTITVKVASDLSSSPSTELDSIDVDDDDNTSTSA